MKYYGLVYFAFVLVFGFMSTRVKNIETKRLMTGLQWGVIIGQILWTIYFFAIK